MQSLHRLPLTLVQALAPFVNRCTCMAKGVPDHEVSAEKQGSKSRQATSDARTLKESATHIAVVLEVRSGQVEVRTNCSVRAQTTSQFQCNRGITSPDERCTTSAVRQCGSPEREARTGQDDETSTIDAVSPPVCGMGDTCRWREDPATSNRKEGIGISRNCEGDRDAEYLCTASRQVKTQDAPSSQQAARLEVRSYPGSCKNQEG